MGFLHFKRFRSSFDRQKLKGNKMGYQTKEMILENCLTCFQKSNEMYPGNCLALMGLVWASFFKKDWKTYSVKFSLLKNTVNNKVSQI